MAQRRKESNNNPQDYSQEKIIDLFRNALSNSEEAELLRQQLKELKDYLKENHPTLYLSTFGKPCEGVELKNSLRKRKSLKNKT